MSDRPPLNKYTNILPPPPEMPPPPPCQGHDWFQLKTHISHYQGGSDSQPEPEFIGLREEKGSGGSKIRKWVYPFLIMCRHCAEIRKVTYRDE